MIKFQNVAYSYDKTTFIENINIDFDRGKITTLIGPNGCGKSTLLKLGARILEPQKGKVLFCDTDIKTLKPKEYAQRVAVLLQSNYPPGITVENYVLSGRYPHVAFLNSFSKQDRDIAWHAMDVTGCQAFWNKNVNQLSGGERQKVFIAMAIAQDTEVILLDEPTTHMDINVSYEIMELVLQLNKDMGKTIIMVLHDLNMAFNYSHKMILMDDGKIIAQNKPEAMAASLELEEVMYVKTRQFSAEGNAYYCFDKKNGVENKA